MTITLLTGCCLALLPTLPEKRFHTCITSPPYYALRDYQAAGQIGQETNPEAYIAKLVEVFRQVKRVLRDDGTLWINLGDSFQDKQLLGIPWRVALALQADGWYWRQRMPWIKRNPMPESAKDRPGAAVEEFLLLSKSHDYYYDYEAVKMNRVISEDRPDGVVRDREYGYDSKQKAMGRHQTEKQRGHSRRHQGFNDRWDAMTRKEQCRTRGYRNCDMFYQSLTAPHGAIGNGEEIIAMDTATKPLADAHFAAYPPNLIEPCILAGSPAGGHVLDPFFGAGTSGVVADRHGRHCTGLEINPQYVEIAKRRLTKDAGMFAEVVCQ